MNEKMNDKLVEAVDGIITSLSEAKVFVKEQLPDVAKQTLDYYTWLYKFRIRSNIGIILICLPVIVKLLCFIFAFNIRHSDYEMNVQVCWLVFWILSGLVALMFICNSSGVVVSNIEDLMKIKKSPKMFLIDHFSDYID